MPPPADVPVSCVPASAQVNARIRALMESSRGRSLSAVERREYAVLLGEWSAAQRAEAGRGEIVQAA